MCTASPVTLHRLCDLKKQVNKGKKQVNKEKQLVGGNLNLARPLSPFAWLPRTSFVVGRQAIKPPLVLISCLVHSCGAVSLAWTDPIQPIYSGAPNLSLMPGARPVTRAHMARYFSAKH